MTRCWCRRRPPCQVEKRCREWKEQSRLGRLRAAASPCRNKKYLRGNENRATIATVVCNSQLENTVSLEERVQAGFTGYATTEVIGENLRRFARQVRRSPKTQYRLSLVLSCQ